MNFFEHQKQARSQTKKLTALFVIAVFAIVLLLNLAIYYAACFSSYYCMPLSAYWLHPLSLSITAGTLAVIGFTSLLRWIQLRSKGGLKAVQMAGARAISLTTKDSSERRLINVVEEMSIASGITLPRLFVMDNESSINAFVAGTEPHNTCLVVTRGCLEKLNRQELQGVIGHEFSHIFNGDMKLNIYLIGVLAGILVIGQVGEFLTHSSSRPRRSGLIGNRSRGGGRAAFVGFALLAVGYIGLFFGRLIKAAISRQREFLADASSVQYTRDNSGISNALYKIAIDTEGSVLQSRSAEELSHLCFERSQKLNLFSGLLATHPPISERIDKIDPNFVPAPIDLPQAHSSKPQSPVGQNNRPRSLYEDNTERGAETAFAGSGATGSLAASRLSSSVGEVAADNLNRTQVQILQLPRQLRNIARDKDEGNSAKHLVFALLILNNTLPRAEIIEHAMQWFDEEALNKVIQILPSLSQQKLPQQYLLLELALPRIANYSKQARQDFIHQCKQLVDIDRKVSLQEYVIFALCLRSATDDQPFQSSINSFRKVESKLVLVLTTFVQQTRKNKEAQLTLLQSLAQGFGITITQQSIKPFNANHFHKALVTLSKLNPLLKQPVIDALAQAIASDQRIGPEEFMLIRAVCNYLDCPIPNIL